MKIVLNNKETELSHTEITVTKLLEVNNFTFKLLTVRINNAFIDKKDYQTTVIKNGDKVDVIHLMSGG